MKTCARCGNLLLTGQTICDRCGERVVEHAEVPVGKAIALRGQRVPPQQQIRAVNYATEPQPKASGTGRLIASCIAAGIILIGGVLAALFIFGVLG